MKNLSIKILSILLISITILAFTCTSYVNATNNSVIQPTTLSNTKESDEADNDDGYIMMYDAKTGKSTNVDMNQLRKDIAIKYGNENIKSLPGYTPNSIIDNKGTLHSISANDYSTQRVYPTSSPYNKAFYVKFDEGTASGSFVGLRVGLTAAHCVFNDNNEHYKGWTCYAGKDGDSYWGTPTGWDTVYYDSRYFENHSEDYDWAILALQADSAVGWFGVKSYESASSLINMNITLLGYPRTEGDFVLGQEYSITSKIGAWIDEKLIRFNGYAPVGFSGGPVYDNSDESIVGILAIGNDNYCFGPRITSNMIDIIRELKGE